MNSYRESITACGAGIDGWPADFPQDGPQEEPDGEPDRVGAQILRGVVRQCRGDTIASFIRPGAPGIEGIEFRVINIAADRIKAVSRARSAPAEFRSDVFEDALEHVGVVVHT